MLRTVPIRGRPPKFQTSQYPLRYLSVCSGIGGFEVGIQNAFPKAQCIGFSEIDPHAIQVYQDHFPSHHNLGSLTDISGRQFERLELIVSGTPCSDLSTVNTSGQGLAGNKSSLFFDFARIVRNHPQAWFLLENVASMKDLDREFISQTLGVDPIFLDSALVVPQTRKRLFWTNIPGAQQWIAANVQNFANQMTLKQCLLPVAQVKHLVVPTHNACLQNCMRRKALKIPFTNPALDDSDCTVSLTLLAARRHWIFDRRMKPPTYRGLDPIEAERLQTFPENWTASVAYTNRMKLLGNAVTCKVISLFMFALARHV